MSKAQQLAEVEVKKFKQMTEALGPSTIRDMAVAGPEMQVRVGERVQVWACVDVCACGCVSWDHVGTRKTEPGRQILLERCRGQRDKRRWWLGLSMYPVF